MPRSLRVALIAAIFTSSLPLPAFTWPEPHVTGWSCLTMIPWVFVFPAWWSNPILLAGCIFLARGNHPGAFWCGVAVVMLAATFPVQAVLETVPVRYLGTITQWRYYFGKAFAGLRVGYWLWLASMITLLLAARISPRLQTKPQTKSITIGNY